MTKQSKAEPTAAAPAPVEVTTARPSRRSRKAGRRPRVGRIHRLYRVDGCRRSVTGPTVPANGAATTAPANDVSATDTTAENDTSRHSLTAQFQAWNEKSIESTIEKGRVIKRGQEELKEQWKAWVVEDLRLSDWSAVLYVQISEHPILSDRKYWKHLPADYRSLYELSLIRDQKKLLEYITKGDVHHDLRRDQAVKLKRATMDKAPAKSQDVLPSVDMDDSLEVLLNVLRVLRSDKDLQDYMRHHPPPSELPSEDEIEDASRYVQDRIRRKRGIR
jgi:hypothetical protein